MPRHVARRQIKRAVERHGQMREVAAYAVAALQHVPRGKIGAPRHEAVLDIIVDHC